MLAGEPFLGFPSICFNRVPYGIEIYCFSEVENEEAYKYSNIYSSSGMSE